MSAPAETIDGVLGPESVDSVLGGPAVATPPVGDAHWKPLFGSLDEPPAGQQGDSLALLGQAGLPDKETRAQTINRAYIGSKLAPLPPGALDANYPAVRDGYAKAAGFTQGEPITDTALHAKIGTQIDENEQKKAIAQEIAQRSNPAFVNGVDTSPGAEMKQDAIALHLTTFSDRFSLNAMEWWKDANKPFKELPAAPQMPYLGLGMGDPALAAGVYNGVLKPLVEGIQTPLGVGTLAAGGLMSAGKSAGLPLAREALAGISGLFTGLMAKASAEQSPETMRVLRDPNSSFQQKVEAAGRMVSDTTLAILGAFHTVAEVRPDALKLVEGKTAPEAAQTLRQEANATAEPHEAVVLHEAAAKLDEVPATEAPKADVPRGTTAPQVEATQRNGKSLFKKATNGIEWNDLDAIAFHFGEDSVSEVNLSSNGSSLRYVNPESNRATGEKIKGATTSSVHADFINWLRSDKALNPEIDAADAATIRKMRKSLGMTETAAAHETPAEPQKASTAAPEPKATPSEAQPVTPAEVEKAYSIKNAAVDATLKEMGEEPAARGERLSFEEATKNARETLAADPEAGAKLVDDLHANPRPVTGNEDALLAHEVTRLELEREAASTALKDAIASGEQDAISQAQDRVATAKQDYQSAADVFAQVGTANALGLSHRAIMLQNDYSLARMERDVSERRAARGEAMTPETTAQLEQMAQEIKDTKAKFDAYRRRASELLQREEPVKARELKAPPEKGSIRAKLAEQAAAARERIKARYAQGRVMAGIDPVDLADHVIVGADLITQGFTKLGEWSHEMIKEFGDRVRPYLSTLWDQSSNHPDAKAFLDKQAATRLKSAKTRMANETAELERRTSEKDTSPRKTTSPIQLDEEGLKIRSDYQKAMEKYHRMIAKEDLANRTTGQKVADTLTRWRRGFLLSSPVTLAKLTAAAALRMTTTPIEEVVGGALGKLPGIKTVAENAPREGGFSGSAEARAVVDAFTKGFADAKMVLTTGKATLDSLKHKPGQFSLSDIAPRAVIDFFGNIHGALKAPVKRAEFARSFAKRIEYAEAHGVDIADPLVQTRISMEAYKDANRAIFMQDNMVVDAYKRLLSRFDQVDKQTGKPSLAGQAASTTARLLLPIVKVPTNIVGETFTYATGLETGAAKIIHQALTDGLDKLTNEQADVIMRQLKKGAVGSAVLAFGYFNANQIGGYFQQGEKRKRGDVAAGEVRAGTTDIPAYLMHNPAMEQLQIGSSVRRVAESKLRRRDPEEQGLLSGAFAAGLGLVEEVPFARESVEMGKLFDPRQTSYVGGELVKSLFVPAVVQWAAKHMDTDAHGNPIKRKPQTLGQHLETGIPGLRENVPSR